MPQLFADLIFHLLSNGQGSRSISALQRAIPIKTFVGFQHSFSSTCTENTINAFPESLYYSLAILVQNLVSMCNIPILKFI